MKKPMQLAGRVARRSLRSVGRVLTRVLASLLALLVAGGLALSGLVLLLTAVIVAQQSISRFLGFNLGLGKMVSSLGRTFSLLGKAL